LLPLFVDHPHQKDVKTNDNIEEQQQGIDVLINRMAAVVDVVVVADDNNDDDIPVETKEEKIVATLSNPDNCQNADAEN